MSIFDQFSLKDLDILRARAERVAHVTQDEVSDVHTALIVVVYGETFLLPIENLLAVYEDHVVVPVPTVPPFIAGVANIRGHIVPVLDLGVLLDVPYEAAATQSTSLVAATNDEFDVAFQADYVGDVLTIAASDLKPIPANLNVAHPEYMKGSLRDGSTLLDIEAILGDEQLIVDDRA